MRRGKLIAKNDSLILKLLADNSYEVREDGSVWLTTSAGIRETGLSEGYRGHRSLYYQNKCLYVHRIVYARFNGILQPDLVVNHRDSNPSNNHPSNLELVTQKSNANHSLQKFGNAEGTPDRKLTFEQAAELRALRAQGHSQKSLGQRFGISRASVIRILKYQTYAA